MKLQVAPHVAEVLRSEVDRLSWTPPWSWPNKLCKELGAAPVWSDNVSVWALSADGDLFRLDCDSATSADPESRPERIRDILLRAADLLPALKTVLSDSFGPEAVALVRPAGAWIDRLRRGEPLGLRAGGGLLEARRSGGDIYLRRHGRVVSIPIDAADDLRRELAEFGGATPFEDKWGPAATSWPPFLEDPPGR